MSCLGFSTRMWPVQFRPGLSRKRYGGWGGKAASDEKNWFELLSGTAVFARLACHHRQGDVIYILGASVNATT